MDQVLEHVTLTNRFLLLTLRKWATIAEHRAGRGDPIPEGESDRGRLEVIGERGSFGWVRPEHMEPAGMPPDEVRAALRRQLGECLILLERMGGGVGALCRVTMTVSALGKIDLYQWLYFLRSTPAVTCSSWPPSKRSSSPRRQGTPNHPLQPTGAAVRLSRGRMSPPAAPAAERGVRHSHADKALALGR